MDPSERYRGCLLGLAVGDAIGTTLEFQRRGGFEPLTDLVGGGPFRLRAGEWTDDTSMALCLAESLLACRGFNAKDQMARYSRWAWTGYLGSNGTCVDIGATVQAALLVYRRNGEPFAGSTDPAAAGNGSIMRLAPIPLFYHPDIDAAEHFAALSSRTTHGAAECLDACRLLARVICRALAGGAKEEVLLGDAGSLPLGEQVGAIASGAYRAKAESEIRGSGYVVRSLEAALWAFDRSETFAEAVLAAANLGDDADRTAAVCGQVAGAYHGASAIPPRWLDLLVMRGEIAAMAESLGAARPDR